MIVTIEYRNYPAKLNKVIWIEKGLETVIVTREFQNYPVKLKLFGLKY